MFRFVFALLLFVVLVFAGTWAERAHAGYYATVVSRGVGTSGSVAVGGSTICYLTPSMAVAATMTAGYVSFYSVDVLDTAGNWSYYLSSGGSGASYRTTGTYGQCSASPSTTVLPNFIGGVSDPAIQGGSIISGSGGGTTSGSSSSADLQAVATAVNALAVQVSNTPKSADIQSLSQSVSAMEQKISDIDAREFDYATATAIFGFFFGNTMLLWFVARSAGQIIQALRQF